jgi:hypothetical protein
MLWRLTAPAVLALPAVMGLMALAEGPPATGDPAAWVDQQVRDRQPRPDEKRFDEIGWSTDVRRALALAKESGRPVFLFTHDGRMAVGRC